MTLRRFLAFLTLAAATALAGCSSSGAISRYTHDSPQAAQQAGIYLDGTGPTAEAAERAEARREAARQAQETRAAARPAPQARAEDISARTTGSRPQTQAEPLKPYSEEWWEKEKREDARLKQKMNICRGC
jgi:hypothetical protein